MALTEGQKVKLSIKINELKNEADSFEALAVADESMYAAAWQQYGSELAGPPASIQENRTKSQELRKKVEFLEMMMRWDSNLSIGKMQELISSEIRNIDARMKALEIKKADLRESLESLTYLKSVIGDEP